MPLEAGLFRRLPAGLPEELAGEDDFKKCFAGVTDLAGELPRPSKAGELAKRAGDKPGELPTPGRRGETGGRQSPGAPAGSGGGKRAAGSSGLAGASASLRPPRGITGLSEPTALLFSTGCIGENQSNISSCADGVLYLWGEGEANSKERGCSRTGAEGLVFSGMPALGDGVLRKSPAEAPRDAVGNRRPGVESARCIAGCAGDVQAAASWVASAENAGAFVANLAGGGAAGVAGAE